jgi:hypothetical protein
MAGSQTWRLYSSDSGIGYSVPIAKHIAGYTLKYNYLGGESEGILFEPREDYYPPMPPGLWMRYIMVRPYQVTGRLRRKNIAMPVGNLTIFRQMQRDVDAHPLIQTFGQGTQGRLSPSGLWEVLSAHGEVRQLMPQEPRT